MSNITQTVLTIQPEDLAEKDKNLPYFLYRVFNGEAQEGVSTVHVNNVNDYPVAFFLEDACSTDGESITGLINEDQLEILEGLMNNKYCKYVRI